MEEKNNFTVIKDESIITLVNWNKELFEKCIKYQEEIERLQNVIKEVREKTEGVRIYSLRSGKTLISTLLNDILDILDKEN